MHPDQPARLAGSLLRADRRALATPPRAPSTQRCSCPRRPLPRAAISALERVQLQEWPGSLSGPAGDDVKSRHRNRAVPPPTSRVQRRHPSMSCGPKRWIKPLAEVACEARLGLDVVRASVAGSLSTSGPETSTDDNDHDGPTQAAIHVFSHARCRLTSVGCRMVAGAPGLRYPRAPAIGGCDSTRRPPNTEIRPAGNHPRYRPDQRTHAESLRPRSPPPAPR